MIPISEIDRTLSAIRKAPQAVFIDNKNYEIYTADINDDLPVLSPNYLGAYNRPDKALLIEHIVENFGYIVDVEQPEPKRERSRRTPYAVVVATVKNQYRPFQSCDIMRDSGCSKSTARKVLGDLLKRREIFIVSRTQKTGIIYTNTGKEAAGARKKLNNRTKLLKYIRHAGRPVSVADMSAYMDLRTNTIHLMLSEFLQAGKVSREKVLIKNIHGAPRGGGRKFIYTAIRTRGTHPKKAAKQARMLTIIGKFPEGISSDALADMMRTHFEFKTHDSAAHWVRKTAKEYIKKGVLTSFKTGSNSYTHYKKVVPS